MKGKLRSPYSRTRRVQRRAKVSNIDDPSLVLTDPAELARAILAQFRDPRYKPPTLPHVAQRLMAMDAKANVDFGDLVELLERDALLTARILKLMRSPLYAGRMPIKSLKNAVVRMGMAAVRNTVMEVVLSMRVMRAAPPFDHAMEALALHSRCTAHVSRLIARSTALDAEHAFMCGLMHDLGAIAALLTLAETLPPKSKVSSFAMLWTAIDRIHERGSARMASLWNLPNEIAIVIGNHHHFVIDGHGHPFAAIVCLAEHLATVLGAPASLVTSGDGSARFDTSPEVVVERALALLDLDDATLERLLVDAKRIIANVRAESADARKAA